MQKPVGERSGSGAAGGSGPIGGLDGAAVPVPVLEAIDRLRAAGFPTHLVGGSVRDLLLGLPVHDWDLATAAPPAEVMRLFPGAIPTGIRYGTVTIEVASERLQVTTYRVEGGYRDRRHPGEVRFVGCVREDLARRDFTVNAIAWAPGEGLCDPFGGVADLRRRLLRAVGKPDHRFAEDPLRALRALRFQAQLGLHPAHGLEAAIARQRPWLERLPAPRVAAEWQRILGLPRPGAALRAADRCRLLPLWFPAWVGLARPLARVTDRLPARAALRIGCLAAGPGRMADEEREAAGNRLLQWPWERWIRLRAAALARAVRRAGREPLPPWHEIAGGSRQALVDLCRIGWAGGGGEAFDLLGLPRRLPPLLRRALAAGVPLTVQELAVPAADLLEAAGWPPPRERGEWLGELVAWAAGPGRNRPAALLGRARAKIDRERGS